MIVYLFIGYLDKFAVRKLIPCISLYYFAVDLC
nr:MAG TPA: hypothetical protein [Caudoviricetes sp.]